MTVAVEQHFPEDRRIIEDKLAYLILPFSMRAFVWLTRPAFARDWLVRALEKRAPGIYGGVMSRKRYIDDRLVEAADSMDAVVNLGAGFDTRAYRLPALAEMPVWEVDQRENIEPKRARLRKLFGEVPEHVKLVVINFDCEELGTVLARCGYSAELRTFFIWEAVTQYLTEAGICSTFEFLGRAAPGSRLAFTYVLKEFIEGKVMYGQKLVYDRYVVKEQAWLCGLDPEQVPGFLGGYGWRVIEDLGYEELAERYVKPTGRDLASTPMERMVYAEKL
jgi:methyltransferase (TIGR00027 family)